MKIYILKINIFIFLSFVSANPSVGASNKVGGTYMTNRIVSTPAAESARPAEGSSTAEEQPKQEPVEKRTDTAVQETAGQQKSGTVSPAPVSSRQHKIFRAAFALSEKSAVSASDVQSDKKAEIGGITSSVKSADVSTKNAVDANVKAGAVSIK